MIDDKNVNQEMGVKTCTKVNFEAATIGLGITCGILAVGFVIALVVAITLSRSCKGRVARDLVRNLLQRE